MNPSLQTSTSTIPLLLVEIPAPAPTRAHVARSLRMIGKRRARSEQQFIRLLWGKAGETGSESGCGARPPLDRPWIPKTKNQGVPQSKNTTVRRFSLADHGSRDVRALYRISGRKQPWLRCWNPEPMLRGGDASGIVTVFCNRVRADRYAQQFNLLSRAKPTFVISPGQTSDLSIGKMLKRVASPL